MGEWERSRLAMSAAEQDVQEALLALRRVLAIPDLRPTTRPVLQRAAAALAHELRKDGPPAAGYRDSLRTAAPK